MKIERRRDENEKEKEKEGLHVSKKEHGWIPNSLAHSLTHIPPGRQAPIQPGEFWDRQVRGSARGP